MIKNKYLDIERTLKSIFDNSTSLSVQAKMSLYASILGSRFINWNFCGFYIASEVNTLEIGPYYGSIIPCTHIKYGQGVCGTAAEREETIIVKNVYEYDNYISCDSETKSEIVIPIFEKNKLISILDIDSIIENDFSETDRTNLEKISRLISK